MSKRGHGEGTIYRHVKTGKWAAQASIGYDYEGKIKRITKYFETRKEAQDWLAQVQHEKNTGQFVEPDKAVFGDWLNRWLTVYVKPKIRPASYANYKDVARNHIIPALGNIPLQKLTTDIIQEFYNRKSENGRLDGKGGLSPRIIHLIHQVINGALKQAVRQKLITHNPAEYTTRPSLKYREMQPLCSKNRFAVNFKTPEPLILLERVTGIEPAALSLGI